MSEKLENLKNIYSKVSQNPGIYQYFDINNNLLYVGKAKNLKKRIRSYFAKDFTPNPKNSARIQKMTSQIANIATLIVENEKEALILENAFIKSQNPKYNILLRDDKTYPYIYINLNLKYPRFELTRSIKNIKNKELSKNILIFGPYTKGAKNILNSIYELFPLVQQSNCLSKKKICLYYQMQKCLGVCEFNEDEKYKNLIQEAIYCIKNPNRFIKTLENKMYSFAENEFFEEAKKCRDTIEILKANEAFSIIDIKKLYDIDILSFYSDGANAIFFKLFVRDGKVISSDHIFLKAQIDNEIEVYTQALLQMANKTINNQILIANISSVNFKILSENISPLGLNIIYAKIGEKAKLAELANINAKYLLEQKYNSMQADELKQLQELFLFDREIERIEAFDTSHHAGSFCVGGMISYESSEFIKANYRHYKLDGQDEISQTRELLTRRAKSFHKISPPSLWLLDGGRAQINIALEILQSVGVDINIIAISKEKRDAKAYRAKGAAKDILRSKDLEFKLDSKDKRLQLMQKLRDEAHRFAISFHRLQKNKII